MTKITDTFIDACLELADNEHSKITEREKELFGLSSTRQRAFINNLCSKDNTTYLEVGIYRGATLISSVVGNPTTKAIGIENFNYDDREPKKYAPEGGIWDNMKSQLYDNIKRYSDPDSKVNTGNIQIIESDYKKADWSAIKNVDVCFFDVTPTTQESHGDFIDLVLPSLADQAVIIFSQYSNSQTCKFIDAAIEDKAAVIEVLHTQQRVSGGLSDATKYYSGLAIFQIKKKAKQATPKATTAKKAE